MMLYFLYELITLFIRQLKRTVTGIKKEDRLVFYLWCPEQDLNLHSFRNTHLKRARLPIPPSGHLVEFHLLELGGKKKQPTLLLFCAQDKT